MGYRIDKETIDSALNDRALGLKVHEICNKYGISKESFYKYFRKRSSEMSGDAAENVESIEGIKDAEGVSRVGDVESVENVENVDNAENIENIESGVKYKRAKRSGGRKCEKSGKDGKSGKGGIARKEGGSCGDIESGGAAHFCVKEFESGESAAKYCEDALEKIIDGGLSSGQKLERLRHVSEILTDRICAAAGDENQYTTVISSDKGKIKKAAAVCPEYTKKVDIKAIKDMASTVRVLTDCVRTLYGIPSFGESTRLYLAGRGLNSDGEVTEPALTVKFTDGIDYAE